MKRTARTMSSSSIDKTSVEARNYADWGEQGQVLELFAVHEAVELCGGFEADLLGGELETGKGWGYQGVEKFVVVYAQDGHLVGDSYALLAGGVEDSVGPVVVASQDADGLGEF